MVANKNSDYISLKFGLVKSWRLENTYQEHKELVDEFNNLYEEMFNGCCSMSSASNKNKGNEELKLRLCDMLDNFFDLGITIDNDFDMKKYKSKKSYRKYILNYGKEQ